MKFQNIARLNIYYFRKLSFLIIDVSLMMAISQKPEGMCLNKKL